MSNVPTGTSAFSIRVMILPNRSAMGTPRRRIPTNPRPSSPPFFSTISYASRTSVRSISDADMSCAFWRSPVLREGAFEFIVACTSQDNGYPLYSTQHQRSSDTAPIRCNSRIGIEKPGRLRSGGVRWTSYLRRRPGLYRRHSALAQCASVHQHLFAELLEKLPEESHVLRHLAKCQPPDSALRPLRDRAPCPRVQ